MFFLSGFVITIISEYVVVLLLQRKNAIKLAFLILGINLITHPAGFLLLNNGFNYYFVETLIICIEAFLYYVVLTRNINKSIKLSIIANLASILLGLLIFGLF